MKRFVAYYRVSTQSQGKSGLGIEAQRTTVREFIERSGDELAHEFVEIESGANVHRPALEKAIRFCRTSKAALIVAKLDRLARNVRFISELLEADVEFVAADMPHANRLTIHILSAIGEYERQLISERTREGLKAAKRRGVKLGNPRLELVRAKGVEAARAKADKFAIKIAPIIEAFRPSPDCSDRDLAKVLIEEGLRTARGGRWTSASVRSVCARASRVNRSSKKEAASA